MRSLHHRDDAFRHHWNSHKIYARDGQGEILCSTPFGIIGILTLSAVPSPNSEIDVLNAFRQVYARATLTVLEEAVDKLTEPWGEVIKFERKAS